MAEGLEPSSAPPDLYRQVLELVTATYDQTVAPHPLSANDLQESWHRTRTHLGQALGLLSDVSDRRPQVERFQEYLDHNELELALDATLPRCERPGTE